MSYEFDRLVDIVKKLRAPGGCPWDRKQTLYSLRQNVIEEVFEFIDALDRRDVENIKEELGDMLLHIVFHSEIAEEEGLFSIDDMINDICEKLIRRHPHVFGNVNVSGVDEVLKNWDEIKLKEKKDKSTHPLDNVPNSLPPIERAYKLQQKAKKTGFDWSSKEECFKEAKEKFDGLKDTESGKNKEELEHKIGDLMFALVGYARLSGIDPSRALNLVNIRFKHRFDCVEKPLNNSKNQE
jgi:tetrapyrrole methylase family protein/MazG family protein